MVCCRIARGPLSLCVQSSVDKGEKSQTVRCRKAAGGSPLRSQIASLAVEGDAEVLVAPSPDRHAILAPATRVLAVHSGSKNILVSGRMERRNRPGDSLESDDGVGDEVRLLEINSVSGSRAVALLFLFLLL